MTNDNYISSQEINNYVTEKKFENINKGVGRVSLDSDSPNVVLVKQNVNLVNYYTDFVTPLADIFKPMATRAGICPFHKDTDPSFHAHLRKGFYHCFGCGFTGSVLAVHRQLRFNYDKVTLTETEAVSELANFYGIKLIPEEELGTRTLDIFEKAAMMLLDEDYEKKYTGEITLSAFKKNNKRLVNTPFDNERKLRTLAELDLQMSAYLTGDD